MKSQTLNNRNMLTKEQSLSVLEPYLAAIYGSIRDGWDAWVKFGEREPGLRKPLNTTARANFVYCHIKESAKQRFGGVEGVIATERRGFLCLVFDKGVTLRFKKLDKYKRSRGIHTKQYLSYLLQLNIPGLEQTKIIGGYTLDSLQSMIAGVHVVCPEGSRNKWQTEIDLELNSGVTSIVPEVDESLPKVRPKEVKERKDQSG